MGDKTIVETKDKGGSHKGGNTLNIFLSRGATGLQEERERPGNLGNFREQTGSLCQRKKEGEEEARR